MPINSADLERRRRNAANEGLIARAVKGSVFYPVGMGLLLFTTEWLDRHRTLGLNLLSIAAVTAFARLVFLRYLLAHRERWTDRRPRGLSVILFAPTLAYGVFAACTLGFFGIESATSVLVTLTVLGFCAGGTSSLAMSRGRHILFLLTLLLPLATAAATIDSGAGPVVSVLVFLFLAFLLKEGRSANEAWLALVEKSFALELAFDDLEAEQRRVVRAHERTRVVLDNIEEGLCVVDLDGRLRSETSPAFDRWFGALEDGGRLSEHLGDPEFAAWIELGLEMLRDDLLPPEVVVEQLPDTLEKEGRRFHFAWRSLSVGDASRAVLVVIRDVTQKRELEEADREQTEMLRLFKILLRDPDGFGEFRRAGGDLVESLLSGTTDREQQLRDLHTLKGNAAVMGVDSIADLCHALEAELAYTEACLEADQKDRLGAAWSTTSELMNSIQGERERVIELSTEEHARLASLVAANAPQEQLSEAIEALCLESVPRRLRLMAAQTRETARRVGKDIVVTVESPPLRLDPGRWRDLWFACVHLMRNAVDHGIEGPEERLRAEKPARGRIVIAVEADDHGMRITLGDDGRGIDWDRVRQEAERSGLPAETREDLERALFADGLSTREAVTELSGRGVGLGAVAREAARLGGTVEVLSRRGAGSEFRLSLPWEDAAPAQLAASPQSSKKSTLRVS